MVAFAFWSFCFCLRKPICANSPWNSVENPNWNSSNGVYGPWYSMNLYDTFKTKHASWIHWKKLGNCMIDASFMYNISFIWIIWCVTKRPNRSFQWCFYSAFGYFNPPSWTELNGICQKKSITQQSLPYLWSRPTVTNHWICPSPLFNAKSRFCCSACALQHIRGVLSKNYTILRTSCFILRTSTQISLIYSDIQLWKLAFFTRWIPMRTRLFSNWQRFVYGQEKGFVAIKIQALCQSDLSWRETYRGFRIPNFDSFWERCFFCKRTFAVCICLGFPYLYSLEMGVKGL